MSIKVAIRFSSLRKGFTPEVAAAVEAVEAKLKEVEEAKTALIAAFSATPTGKAAIAMASNRHGTPNGMRVEASAHDTSELAITFNTADFSSADKSTKPAVNAPLGSMLGEKTVNLLLSGGLLSIPEKRKLVSDLTKGLIGGNDEVDPANRDDDGDLPY